MTKPYYFEVYVHVWDGEEHIMSKTWIFSSRMKAKKYIAENKIYWEALGSCRISLDAKKVEDGKMPDRETLSCLLSNASAHVCGVQWWDCDKDEYAAAKAKIAAELELDSDDQACVEDVWAQMLLDGKKLRLLDPESDWHWSGHKKGEMLWNHQIVSEGCRPVGGSWHEIDLIDILDAAEEYAEQHIAGDCGPDLGKIVEDGDFWDADAVIQIAMYGEVVYG